MNKGGPGVHPWKLKKKRWEMVQSELFWSLFVIFFQFFLESGATPVYPEQLAGMGRAYDVFR